MVNTRNRQVDSPSGLALEYVLSQLRDAACLLRRRHAARATVIIAAAILMGCTNAENNATSPDAKELYMAADHLMEGSPTMADLTVLEERTTGEFMGTLTGKTERLAGRPILYNVRLRDSFVWAYETRVNDDASMKWADCSPTGKCVTGLGKHSFSRHFFSERTKRKHKDPTS